MKTVIPLVTLVTAVASVAIAPALKADVCITTSSSIINLRALRLPWTG